MLRNKIGQGRFLPHSSQFSIHNPRHIRRYAKSTSDMHCRTKAETRQKPSGILAQEKFLIRISALLNCQQGHGPFRGVFQQSLEERSGIFPQATAASFHAISNSLFIIILPRGPQILLKYKGNLKIPSARRVIQPKFETEDLHLLGTKEQKLVARDLCSPGGCRSVYSNTVLLKGQLYEGRNLIINNKVLSSRAQFLY
jgi:hypothetical protein